MSFLKVSLVGSAIEDDRLGRAYPVDGVPQRREIANVRRIADVTRFADFGALPWKKAKKYTSAHRRIVSGLQPCGQTENARVIVGLQEYIPSGK